MARTGQRAPGVGAEAPDIAGGEPLDEAAVEVAPVAAVAVAFAGALLASAAF